MIALVSGLGALPAVGTAVGAGLGAIANFVLGRAWIFRAGSDRASSQALRYALVSLASLALNSAAEHALATVLGMHYIAARVLVAIGISLGWNYPMQRYFVFRPRPR
jgi:putative flippase GtrA